MGRLSHLCVIVALCTLTMSYCFAADSEPKQPDPYENTSILVEAFVVRVSNAALAEAGVNSIAQAPDAVSPLKILWCLKDEEKANVISGAKVASRHNREAKAENKDTFYLKKESSSTTTTPQGPQTTTAVSFQSYNSGVTFTVVPAVKSENLLGFFFSYSESGILQNEDKTAPPSMFSYKWESSVTAEPGKPLIAGAAQGLDTTTFLVLTATIQSPTNAQQ